MECHALSKTGPKGSKYPESLYHPTALLYEMKFD